MSKVNELLDNFPVEEGLDEDAWNDALHKLEALKKAMQEASDAVAHLSDSKAWIPDQAATKKETAKIRAKLKEMSDDLHTMLPKPKTYHDALVALEMSAKRFYKLHAKGKKV